MTNSLPDNQDMPRFLDCQYCGGVHVESDCPTPPNLPDTTKLDTEKYIERLFWDVYYAGKEDAKHLAGSNREVLKATKLATQLLLEARLSELNRLINLNLDKGYNRHYKAGFLAGVSQMGEAKARRIAELKQQLEKGNNE